MWLIITCWIASALVFSAFFMQKMLPLRMVAVASNLAFIAYALLGLEYGAFSRLYPILVLHSALLPLNLARLRKLHVQQNPAPAAAQAAPVPAGTYSLNVTAGGWRRS